MDEKTTKELLDKIDELEARLKNQTADKIAWFIIGGLVVWLVNHWGLL